MSTTVAIPRSQPLAQRLPISDARVRSAVLIVSGALLTALAAQISFHVPWTPVPYTGQTFAVLLTGAALGWRDGAASQLLYVALGAVGLPFYAGAEGGWSAVSGSTGGYLVGYIVTAAVVGALAERGKDRRVATAVPAMLAGSAVIYLFGVTWLAHVLDVSASKAIELGLTPFVIGDAIKLGLAGLLLPAAHRLTRR